MSTPTQPLCAFLARPGESLSVEALRLAVTRAEAAWLECGVQHGEPVAIRLAESVESAVACLGVTSAGGVPVAVDPLMPADEWQRLCLQNGWRFILAESRTGQPAALRDFVLTRAEWRRALDNAPSGAAESRRIQA